MQILTISGLTISFGPTPLLQDATLQVHAGEHIALVGRNGTGKSTLLKIIAGEPLQDYGDVQLSKGMTVALLPQTVPLTLTGSVYSIVASGLSLTSEHWSHDQKIQTVLSKLDLNGTDEINALSGGLKRRVLLARALVNDPDILLLDEPTNHLDMESVLWLEGFLKKYRKTIILITHDRDFMSNIATRIIEIDYQTLLSWPGNYTHYCQLKEAHMAEKAREQALFDKHLAEEEVWIRQGIKARRTRNEGRVRRLEALRLEKSRQFQAQSQTKVEIQSAALSGKTVFTIEDVSFSYRDKKIIDRFSAIVARGDCVGIVGPNGAGKSTLLKLLLGELIPTSGTIRSGTNLEIAYFDQYRLELDDKQSVIDNVALGREKITVNGRDKHIISYLQDFLFSPDRARVKVSALSGGEKNRLLLAKLFAKPANLIVMDEPTNDLDIETLELLEEKLTDFPGTLLIVSHDRAFLNNVVTQLWVIESDGKIQEYVGGHFDWVGITPKKTNLTPQKKEIKTSTITQNERRELNSLLKKITTIENDITTLENATLETGFYQKDTAHIKAHGQKLSEMKSLLEQCYARWQVLEDKL